LEPHPINAGAVDWFQDGRREPPPRKKKPRKR